MVVTREMGHRRRKAGPDPPPVRGRTTCHPLLSGHGALADQASTLSLADHDFPGGRPRPRRAPRTGPDSTGVITGSVARPPEGARRGGPATSGGDVEEKDPTCPTPRRSWFRTHPVRLLPTEGTDCVCDNTDHEDDRPTAAAVPGAGDNRARPFNPQSD